MRAELRVTLVVAAAATALSAPAAASVDHGPNTRIDPYVLPVADGVHVTSLLTVDGLLGDGGAASNGYEMVGIPDGLGAMEGPGRDFTLFMHHELNALSGAVRRHGQIGAFVSKWEIDPRSWEVESGSDLINPGVQYWNYVTQQYQLTPSPAGDNPRTFGTEVPNVTNDDFVAQPAPFGRFCSANLTDPGQLYNARTGRGTLAQIFFSGEETGTDGRLFGTLPDGTAKQLPRHGLFSWENSLAAHNRSDTTLMIGAEDVTAGQLWTYVGDKRRKGDAFDRAGLTNGVNHVVDLVDETVSGDAAFRAKYGAGVPVEFDLAEVDWDQPHPAQQAEGAAEGLTLSRLEDGVWDPRRPNDFYFVATDGGDTSRPGINGGTRDSGGVWRLSFEDIERPRLGGTLTLLLDGVGGEEDVLLLNSPDNVDMDRHGNLLIQEDPGNSRDRARIVAYQVRTGDLGIVAQFSEALFSVPPVMTTNEESSGIIDASEVVGRGWWLFDAQVHRPVVDDPPMRVTEGQMLAMRVKRWSDVYR